MDRSRAILGLRGSKKTGVRCAPVYNFRILKLKARLKVGLSALPEPQLTQTFLQALPPPDSISSPTPPTNAPTTSANEIVAMETSALLQNVQFFRSQCPSPPGGTDSPPLRSTILGSFLGRGAPAILLNRISTYRISISTSLYRAESSAHRLQRSPTPHPKLWRCKHVPVQHKDSLAAPPSSLMWRIYLRPRHTPRKSQATAAVFPLPHPLYSTLAYFRVEPVDDPSPGFRIIPAWRDTFSRLRSSAFSTVRRRRHPAPPTPRPSGIYIKTPTPFPLPNCLPLPSRLTCQDSLLRPLSTVSNARQERARLDARRVSPTPTLPPLSRPFRHRPLQPAVRPQTRRSTHKTFPSAR
ncbi:hypothetical protein R3P38DRAFT_3343886 [Favolaschia claudopus]|uniref:Uncharacterized protein n=1 Tax=Favolaschia claudopus TaxID=2862362 RepID=A0AAW0DG03_9AGAR